jgi:hypothetical protein
LWATKKRAKNAKKPPENGGFVRFFLSFPSLGKIKAKTSNIWKKLAAKWGCFSKGWKKEAKPEE